LRGAASWRRQYPRGFDTAPRMQGARNLLPVSKKGAVSVKQPIVGADAYGMPDQVADSFKLKASPDSLLSSGVIQCSGGVTRQPRMSFAQMIPDMVTDSRPAPGKVDAPAKYSPLIGARK